MEGLSLLLQERLALLAAALLLGMLLLGPYRLYHALRLHRPGLWWRGRLLRLCAKLNRAHRPVATRLWRGLLLVLLLGGGAALLGWLIERAGVLSPWLALLDLLLLMVLLPLRPLRDHAAEVARAVKKGELAKARGLAEPLARREVAALDGAALRRVALEDLAENFADKVLAPALWYLLVGLPGLLLVRQVNLLDGLIGHKSPQYRAFGWAAARLDDVLLWIPARLSALILALAAAFVPGGRPLSALACALGQGRRTASPNSGWPLAAMAGALYIHLGGPRRYQQARIDDGWLGPARASAKVTQVDIRRGLWLFVVASLLLILSAAAPLAVVL